MRDTHGLIDALVGYLQKAVEDSRVDQKVRSVQSRTKKHHFNFYLNALLNNALCVAGSGECCVCDEEPVLSAVR